MILILLACALCLALFGAAIVGIACWARHHAHPYGPLEDITLNSANRAVLPARPILQQDETLKTMKLRVERTVIELGLRYSPCMAKQDDVAATVKGAGVANPESERASRGEPPCSANGRG